jgi:hypothetical protein
VYNKRSITEWVRGGIMGETETSGPVIVMVEARERENIQKFFQNSRFNVFDAVTIFDALEAISDFTVRCQPDVLLLNVDCCDSDLPLIRSTYEAITSQAAPEMMALKTTGGRPSKGPLYQGDLAHIAARLDRMIPDRSQAAN